MALLHQGNKNRTTEATGANASWPQSKIDVKKEHQCTDLHEVSLTV